VEEIVRIARAGADRHLGIADLLLHWARIDQARAGQDPSHRAMQLGPSNWD
jgi:hypothetical protein